MAKRRKDIQGRDAKKIRVLGKASEVEGKVVVASIYK